MFDHPDWKVRISETLNPFMVRMHIFRQDYSGRAQLVTGWDEQGQPTVEDLDPNTISPFPGFIVPRSVADVIRQGLEPVKDRKGEVDAVREALQVERGRVQRLLEAAVNSIGAH